MARSVAGEEEFRMSKGLLIYGIIVSTIIALFISVYIMRFWLDIRLWWLIISGLLILNLVLHYLTTSVIADAKGVTYRTGVFTASERHIQYSAINTLDIRQDPIARIADYGDIYIYTGNDKTKIRLKGIDQPRKLKRLIEERL